MSTTFTSIMAASDNPGQGIFKLEDADAVLSLKLASYSYLAEAPASAGSADQHSWGYYPNGSPSGTASYMFTMNANPASGSPEIVLGSSATRLTQVEGLFGVVGASQLDGALVVGGSSTEASLTAYGSMTLTAASASTLAASNHALTVLSAGVGGALATGEKLSVAGAGSFTGALDVGGALTAASVAITGNLTVSGTTTTIHSSTVTIEDKIYGLGGSNAADSAQNDKDTGHLAKWWNGSAAKEAFWGFDDSASAFAFIPDATETSGVISGDYGPVIASEYRGTSVRVDNAAGSAVAAISTAGVYTGVSATLSGDIAAVNIDASGEVECASFNLTANGSASLASFSAAGAGLVASMGIGGALGSGTGEVFSVTGAADIDGAFSAGSVASDAGITGTSLDVSGEVECASFNLTGGSSSLASFSAAGAGLAASMSLGGALSAGTLLSVGGGAYVSGMLGTGSLGVGGSSSPNAEISSAGAITGISVDVSGEVEAQSLNIHSGTADVAAISASGAYTGASLDVSGEVECASFNLTGGSSSLASFSAAGAGLAASMGLGGALVSGTVLSVAGSASFAGTSSELMLTADKVTMNTGALSGIRAGAAIAAGILVSSGTDANGNGGIHPAGPSTFPGVLGASVGSLAAPSGNGVGDGALAKGEILAMSSEVSITLSAAITSAATDIAMYAVGMPLYLVAAGEVSHTAPTQGAIVMVGSVNKAGAEGDTEIIFNLMPRMIYNNV
jgi:hypothetical protein